MITITLVMITDVYFQVNEKHIEKMIKKFMTDYFYSHYTVNKHSLPTLCTHSAQCYDRAY
jgi:hypothetical protein